MTIQTRLQEIRTNIVRAGGGRAVELLAVSKTYGADAVREVIAAGHMVFAENRVQEAEGKFPELRDEFPELKLHLIGMLQTNKVKDAVRLFDVVHTVDRPTVAEKLANEMAKQARMLPCFIQVNTGEEPQKAGVMMHELAELLEFCRAEAPLNIQGLMCIPPLNENPAPHFMQLAELATEYQLPFLSMGMSGDYETAIACGATHIRVGSALFGNRIVIPAEAGIHGTI